MLYHCHSYCFCGNYWLLNHLLQTRCIHACCDEMCSVKVTVPKSRSEQKWAKTLAKWSGHSITGKHPCWSVSLCVDQLEGIAFCINAFDPWCINNTQAHTSNYDELGWRFFYVIKTTFHVLINFQYACHFSKMSAHYFNAYGRAVCNVSSSKD